MTGRTGAVQKRVSCVQLATLEFEMLIQAGGNLSETIFASSLWVSKV